MTKKQTKRRKGQSASKVMLGSNVCPKPCWDKAFDAGYRDGCLDEKAAIARALFDKKGIVLVDFYNYKPYQPNDLAQRRAESASFGATGYTAGDSEK